jgi:hypothetical protein|tara:strand:- start:104 stop:1105 length:1002 start_codon:yes stop_codon:yes gene_type:complete
MICGDCEGAEDIASVIETFDGNVHVQPVGKVAGWETDDVKSDFVVIYQRGILENTNQIERSHKAILSYYKIKSANAVANVPWKNLAWSPRNTHFSYASKSSCGCLKTTCRTCFSTVTSDNIKVVAVRECTRVWRFQWYVAFDGDDGLLTRVPPSAVSRIKSALSPPGHCTCGNCRQPLLSMECQRTIAKSAEFDAKAVDMFGEYRSRVNSMIKSPGSISAGKRKRRDCDMQEGTCAICLEDKFVCKKTCVMKRCSLEICSECHSTTRGICPLCDRAKLSDSVLFMCRGCEKPVWLKEFGHACFTCDEPGLCARCFKAFGQCARCECNNGNETQ